MSKEKAKLAALLIEHGHTKEAKLLLEAPKSAEVSYASYMEEALQEAFKEVHYNFLQEVAAAMEKIAKTRKEAYKVKVVIGEKKHKSIGWIIYKSRSVNFELTLAIQGENRDKSLFRWTGESFGIDFNDSFTLPTKDLEINDIMYYFKRYWHGFDPY